MALDASVSLGSDSSKPSAEQRKRFTKDDHRSLPEISDPHDLADDTQTTWRETIIRYRWYSLAVSLLATFVLIFMLAYTRHLIPDLAGNRYVRLAGAAGVIAIVAYALGQRQQRGLSKHYDWLVLVEPEGVTRYLGYYKAAENGTFPLFVPVKGFTLRGHRGEPYRMEEMSYEITKSWQKANQDPDDPAIIRLHPGFAEVSFTDTGTVVGQLTNGLSADPFGNESTLVATMPNLAEESRIDQVRKQLENTIDELQHTRTELQATKRQRDNVLDEASKPVQQRIDEFLARHRYLAESQDGRRRSRGRDRDESWATEPRESFDRMEQELSLDD